MKVLWTPRAASDLDDAVAYISRDKPLAALRVADRIYRETMALATTPEIGSPGKVPGTRELYFYPWQYAAVYRVASDTVRIIRIRQTSRLWP